MDAVHYPGLRALMLGSAKFLGAAAQGIGQPAVLGELVAGVMVGPSMLGLVDPQNEVFRLLGDVGVVILLFEIGLETDLGKPLQVGGLLIVAAVAGKFLAGCAPFWFPGRKSVIGFGMVPRGEVGLIFAQTGLTSGVFDRRLFSAIALMVLVTTFLTPPLLNFLHPSERRGRPRKPPGGVGELVTQS